MKQTEKSMAQRFDEHVRNNMRLEREVIERRQQELVQRPEVTMEKKDG